jgi:hypothetical protein
MGSLSQPLNRHNTEVPTAAPDEGAPDELASLGVITDEECVEARSRVVADMKRRRALSNLWPLPRPRPGAAPRIEPVGSAIRDHETEPSQMLVRDALTLQGDDVEPTKATASGHNGHLRDVLDVATHAFDALDTTEVRPAERKKAVRPAPRPRAVLSSGGKEGGVFALSRNVFDHPFFKQQKFTEVLAWISLLRCAAWRDCTVRGVTLNRGQLTYSVRYLADWWQWPASTVHDFLKRLQKSDMIEMDSRTGLLIITICNYDKYQFAPSANRTASDDDPGRNPDNPRTNKKKSKELKKSQPAAAEQGAARARGEDRQAVNDPEPIKPRDPADQAWSKLAIDIGQNFKEVGCPTPRNLHEWLRCWRKKSYDPLIILAAIRRKLEPGQRISSAEYFDGAIADDYKLMATWSKHRLVATQPTDHKRF